LLWSWRLRRKYGRGDDSGTGPDADPDVDSIEPAMA